MFGTVVVGASGGATVLGPEVVGAAVLGLGVVVVEGIEDGVVVVEAVASSVDPPVGSTEEEVVDAVGAVGAGTA